MVRKSILFRVSTMWQAGFITEGRVPKRAGVVQLKNASTIHVLHLKKYI